MEKYDNFKKENYNLFILLIMTLIIIISDFILVSQ